MDAEAAVVGYWSNNTASVELKLSVRNVGESQLESPVPVAIVCRQGNEVVEECGSRMSVLLMEGDGPTLDLVTLRLPTGDTTLILFYGDNEVEELDLHVPERILGVQRNVWACFSDTSTVNTVWEEDQGIGCAGWSGEAVRKWDQTSPLRVSINGPDGFSKEFENILHDLAPVLNLQFEFVGAGYSAEIKAFVGFTDPELEERRIFCDSFEAFGCASTQYRVRSGKVNSSRIIVYNLWPEKGFDFNDFDDPTREHFRSAMIHEAVHVFGAMSHRTELLSIMNEEVHHRVELSPMDEALLRLHGHPLVTPGMTMAEVEELLVFNDELIDPQPIEPRMMAWRLVSNSYIELREAATAAYSVRSSFPGCSRDFGWADYEAGNLTRYHPYFGWVKVEDGQSAVYAMRPFPDQFEHWRRSPLGWSEVGFDELSGVLSGWNGDLSDPHHMLESMLFYADWSDADISFDQQGNIRLGFDLDAVGGPETVPVESVNIVVTVNPENYVLTDYSMTWQLGRDRCETYRIEAINGRYGTPFDFPEEMRRRSDFIQSCEPESLDPLGSYVRASGSWYRECPTGEGYSRFYRFSLDDWSFLRFEASSSHDLLLKLWKNNSSGAEPIEVEPIEPEASGYLEGGLGVPEDGRLHWGHVSLPAGEYTAEVVALHRATPGDFTLTLTSQSTPPPPYKFKSISVWHGRSCGVLHDGTPLCWGKRNVDGGGSVAPVGKFTAISLGKHTCALREDGSPVCWDFANEGEHTCAPKNGDTYCRLDNQYIPTETPKDRDGGAVVLRQVTVIGGYYDQTPPPGERLTSLSVGWVHGCGLRREGTAVCWGSNQEGKSTPPAGERFMAVDAGVSHSCGLRQDGTAVCWGSDWRGQTTAPEGEHFIAISAGEEHACALRQDGSTACWGVSDALGVCPAHPGGEYSCHSISVDKNLPQSPPEDERLAFLAENPHCGLTFDGRPVCWTNYQSGLLPVPEDVRFTSISTSSQHACALMADGVAACWGGNRYGESSPPSGANLTSHQPLRQEPADLVSISSGSHHTCALDSEGYAYCWGPNWWRGRFSGRFTSISSGWDHSCGVKLDGTVACRGSNDYGQSTPPDGTFVSVTSGSLFSCGLRADGTVHCWGAGYLDQSSPVEQAALLSISGACGIRFDGRAVCWGDDYSFQEMPPPGELFSSISSRTGRTCALRIDGSPKCWGSDRHGQTAPPEGETFVSISSGRNHTCGLNAGGAVLCWGGDIDGQASPPQNETFIAISSGDYHTCGIRTSGAALCWGHNEFGQASPRR